MDALGCSGHDHNILCWLHPSTDVGWLSGGVGLCDLTACMDPHGQGAEHCRLQSTESRHCCPALMPHRAWPLPGTAVLTAVLHLPQPSVPVCMPHGQTDGCMTDANTRGCGPSASWISDPISFLSCDYCTLHPTVSDVLLLQYGIVRCRGLMSAWRYSPGRKPRRLTRETRSDSL